MSKHTPEPDEERVLMIYDAETFEPIRVATERENFKPNIFKSKGRFVRPLMGYASELKKAGSRR